MRKGIIILVIVMATLTIEQSKALKPQEKAAAKLQDRLIEVIYGPNGPSDATLHGGSLVWRGHGSNRFSADIDIYSLMTNIETAFLPEVERAGLDVNKFRDTGNVIYAKFGGIVEDIGGKPFGKYVEMKVEIRRAPVEGTIASYTNSDGRTIPIISISPDQLVQEKIIAYKGRQEVRDLYDVYHLVTVANAVNLGENQELRSQIEEFVDFVHLNRPVNEGDLAKRIYVGNAPSFNDMLVALGKVKRS